MLAKILVAIFILALVIFSVMTAMNVSTRGTVEVKDNACQFASEILEDGERARAG